MVQFLSINFFLGFLQFLLGFSKLPVFLCHSVFYSLIIFPAGSEAFIFPSFLYVDPNGKLTKMNVSPFQ